VRGVSPDLKQTAVRMDVDIDAIDQDLKQLAAEGSSESTATDGKSAEGVSSV
jgi:hypothetical protein